MFVVQHEKALWIELWELSPLPSIAYLTYDFNHIQSMILIIFNLSCGTVALYGLFINFFLGRPYGLSFY